METIVELRKRGLCSECGTKLIQTSNRGAVCPKGHGKILPPLTDRQKPVAYMDEATEITQGVFVIESEKGFWEQRGNSPNLRKRKGEVRAVRQLKDGKLVVRLFRKILEYDLLLTLQLRGRRSRRPTPCRGDSDT